MIRRTLVLLSIMLAPLAVAEMPDVMVMNDGTRVTTREQWHRRREEIKKIIEDNLTGHAPPAPEQISSNELSRDGNMRKVHLSWKPDSGGKDSTAGTAQRQIGFDITIFLPPGDGPFPTIVHPTFKDPAELKSQYQLALDRGYAVAAFYYQQAGRDKPDYIDSGFFPAYPGYDWRDLRAWAWAMSRVVDYLETQSFADKSKIIALGHSRLGKTTLIAGAFDDRFALVAPAGSGCAGTGAFRYCGKGRGGKEGLEEVVTRIPQWVSPKLADYSNKVETLPFDQHFLISLCAPRPFIAADATEDQFTSVNALRQSYQAAKPAYEFLGNPENLAIHFRPGKHKLDEQDWRAILDFADARLPHPSHP